MLHTIIYIQRTGSSTFSDELANRLNANLLGEIMHLHRTKHTIDYAESFNKIISELISQSITEDIVVKFHISDITRIMNSSRYVIKQLFQNSYKLYYPIRLDYKSQLISMIIARQTLEWTSDRNVSNQIKIHENDILSMSENLKRMLSIQGEWSKQFPGELIILENRKSNPYPKYNITFKGIKSFLKGKNNSNYSYLFPEIDVMEIFNNGNSEYRIN